MPRRDHNRTSVRLDGPIEPASRLMHDAQIAGRVGVVRREAQGIASERL